MPLLSEYFDPAAPLAGKEPAPVRHYSLSSMLAVFLFVSTAAISAQDRSQEAEETAPIVESLVAYQENLQIRQQTLIDSKLEVVLPTEQQLKQQAELGLELAALVKDAGKSIEKPKPAPEPQPGGEAPVAGGRTLNVQAYAYALHGRTASGRYTEPGIVAVDPRVIPLGSKLYIPGYGWGVAADTGGAILGNKIDVWFPSTSQCYQWGVRNVTIQVFPKGS